MKSSDGISPATALALTTAPAIKVSKNGSTFANRDSTQVVTARHGGHYTVPLSSDDLNTEGRLKLIAASSTGRIATWEYFDVVSQNWWDSKFSTGDYLHTDVIQIEGADASTQLTQAVMNSTVEGSYTLKTALRLMLSFAAGLSTGAGSTTLTFYGVASTGKARITAQCGSSGNRKSIAYDVTT